MLALGLTAQNFTSPPGMPVRTMAEWEESQALMVSWYASASGGNEWYNTLTEIIRAARKECKVIVNCSSQTVVDQAKNYLTQKGVDITSNIDFFITGYDSIWARDYGPNCVYANDVDSLMIVDWLYNRISRPQDNLVPIKIGEHLGLPVFSTTTAPYDLVNTGGNFMTDGMGTAFASKLIFRNNDQIANGEPSGSANDIIGTSNHTESSINNIFQEYMGIDRYIKMDELLYDGIHHIDMHMKLLDEETLLVGEYPQGISDGPQLEANLQYVLSQFKTSFGHNFKVVRVPMPPYNNQYPPFNFNPSLKSRYPTYANALFINRTVIMPKYDSPLDAAAQDTFQKYLPGYTIVPVDCINIIGSGGAVHCITKEIGVADPLLITHSALTCQDNATTNGYPVFARLQHRSGISTAQVYYTTDLHGAWQSVNMQPYDPPTDDTAFVWKAVLPEQPSGATVYYYISATANNGKTLTRPLTAPGGWWSFCVTQSSDAPEASTVQIDNIYPNPASAVTVIPITTPRKTRAHLYLLNVLGQPVEKILEGELPAGSSKHFFDARRYEPGIYFVELQANGFKTIQKVVIR